MSIQAVSWVLDHSQAKRGERLVLIAIANHYDFNDPALVVIARESRLSRSAVIRAIQALEQAGELVVDRDEAGGRSKKNRYNIPGYERSRNATNTGETVALAEETVALAEETVAFPTVNGSADATRTISNHIEPREPKRSPSVDFEPTLAHATYATDNGLNITEEIDAWLDWCEAHDRRYASLNAGFSTWLRHAVEFGRGGPPIATLEELAEPTRPPEVDYEYPPDEELERGREVAERALRQVRAATGLGDNR